jgi:phage terminase large subunit
MDSLVVPSYEQLRRVLERDDAQRALVNTGPMVLWSNVDEPEGKFAARVHRVRMNWNGRILCVVPYQFNVPEGTQRVELAAKAHAALHPVQEARYIVLRGGRGGCKSWSAGLSLVLHALMEPIRVLAVREIQRSLKDSSLRLLADLIARLKLDRYFQIGANSISSHCGASFTFEGCWQNVSRIKSFEGVDVCWAEQGEQLSEESWSILLPTIRKPGSQILITYNPDLIDDPTHQRFTVATPPNAINVSLNFLADNPWATRELLAEADYLEKVDHDSFMHIWMGELRLHSDAQVLKGKYEISTFEISRDWEGPYLGCDFGYANDPMTLIKSWVNTDTNELFVSHEAYGIQIPIDRMPAFLSSVPGSRDSTIFCDNARPELINHLNSHDYANARACKKWDGSVMDGVDHLRSFAHIYIHSRCPHTALEAKLWSYKTDRTTNAVLPDLKAGNDHTMDAIRYSLQEKICRPAGAGLLEWYAQQNAAAKAPAPQSSASAQSPAGRVPVDDPHNDPRLGAVPRDVVRPGESPVSRAERFWNAATRRGARVSSL